MTYDLKSIGRQAAHHPGRRDAHQQGQALTEFLVLSLVVTPLFLLVPVIAKYQDLAHATQIASRYVAFDAMVRNDGVNSLKPASELEDEVRRRFFGNPDAPVKTGDTAGDFNAHQNLFWRDPNGNALIKQFSDVRVNYGAADSANADDAFSDASDEMAFKLAPGVLSSLDLAHKGIFTAGITVTLANFSSDTGGFTQSYEEFKNINLTMTRRSSLLVDGWSAKDVEQVEDRINKFPLIPGKVLESVKPILDAAVVVVESPSCLSGGCIRGPQLGKLDMWRDLVPDDRLK